LIYLRKARNVRAIGTLFLKVDPSWAPLHGNREFRDLVSDITLATGQ
jgi:hypothetical protein